MAILMCPGGRSGTHMTEQNSANSEENLVLGSQLSDITRVRGWIEQLARRHAIPENTQFAMNLCLEEALSNCVRHGYAGESGHAMTVRFTMPSEVQFVLTVEDEAPHFDPLTVPYQSPLKPDGDILVGGQGLRLIREFADKVEYKPRPIGNRLTMVFSISG